MRSQFKIHVGGKFDFHQNSICRQHFLGLSRRLIIEKLTFIPSIYPSLQFIHFKVQLCTYHLDAYDFFATV